MNMSPPHSFCPPHTICLSSNLEKEANNFQLRKQKASDLSLTH